MSLLQADEELQLIVCQYNRAHQNLKPEAIMHENYCADKPLNDELKIWEHRPCKN